MTQEMLPAFGPHPTGQSALVGAGLRQAVTGVIPPLVREGLIREVRPTVVESQSALAALGKRLIQSYVLAPLGWLILAPLYFKKIAPFFCKRYTLTNRRLMIQRGLKPSPIQEVLLTEIDEVRIDPASLDAFFLSGDLNILSKGEIKMRLVGVSEPESFQHAILNAASAWAGKSTGVFVPASAPAKV